MTATDELRRLLDGRGVEYVEDYEYGKKYPPERSITWSCDIAGEDMTVTARDYCININDDGSADYCLDLEFHEVFTPEQAVEATLGSDLKAENEKLRELVRIMHGELVSCEDNGYVCGGHKFDERVRELGIEVDA